MQNNIAYYKQTGVATGKGIYLSFKIYLPSISETLELIFSIKVGYKYLTVWPQNSRQHRAGFCDF